MKYFGVVGDEYRDYTYKYKLAFDLYYEVTNFRKEVI